MLNEMERQVENYKQVRSRLRAGKMRPDPVPKLTARQKMKALLEREIRAIDIIPRGRPLRWLKSIELIDADVLALEDRQWREEVTNIIMRFRENLARVKGGSRDTNIVECRRAICHALHQRGWSLPRIGHLMNRDHTSVYSLMHPEKHRERFAKARALHVGKPLATEAKSVES